MKIKIAIIAGTRPELIKLAPLIKLIYDDPDFDLLFIFSGQHYDYNLFTTFLNDLELPQPDINIKVGSGTHGYQEGTLIMEIEKILIDQKPDVVIAQGDTNTVFASALATRKLNKCFMHLEAGIRSFDKRMPEEINRVLTGACSMYHLVPTERAALNLLFEGIPRETIFIVGNSIVDTVLQTKEIANRKSKISEKLRLTNEKPLVLITLHRPANVDNRENLEMFFNKLKDLNQFQFIFPMHPRTKKNIEKFNLTRDIEKYSNLLITEPLGYLDFFKLFSLASCILTDSGGIQEEASIIRIPCITLRNNTERPETIEYGSNVLVGMDMNKLEYELNKILINPNYLKGNPGINPFGDGKTSQRVVKIIKKLYQHDKLIFDKSRLWKEIPLRILLRIGEKDNNLTVQEYEKANNLSIQIIFNKNGVPSFPKDSTILTNGDSVIAFKYLS
ncbi:MAG: non-hydrolyzing UDP-N-acetylglucosamine 2-epimerase [Promethearchaeota archaeon]